MTIKSHLFRDKLKAPGYLSQFDVARIRKIALEATDQDFQEYLSCSKEGALRILGFWEVAQVELWDAEILQRFFHEWIYKDREIVAARIKAAQSAGRLAVQFSPEKGLQWLESENVLMGMIPQWVRANARVRNTASPAPQPETAHGVVANDDVSDPERRLKLLRTLGGTATEKNGVWRFTCIETLVQTEKAAGRKRSDAKTIRGDLRYAAQSEREAKRAGLFDSAGQR